MPFSGTIVRCAPGTAQLCAPGTATRCVPPRIGLMDWAVFLYDPTRTVNAALFLYHGPRPPSMVEPFALLNQTELGGRAVVTPEFLGPRGCAPDPQTPFRLTFRLEGLALHGCIPFTGGAGEPRMASATVTAATTFDMTIVISHFGACQYLSVIPSLGNTWRQEARGFPIQDCSGPVISTIDDNRIWANGRFVT